MGPHLGGEFHIIDRQLQQSLRTEKIRASINVPLLGIKICHHSTINVLAEGEGNMDKVMKGKWKLSPQGSLLGTKTGIAATIIIVFLCMPFQPLQT